MKNTFRLPNILILISLLFFIVSMLIVKVDNQYQYSWTAFWLHILSLLLISLVWIYSLKSHVASLFQATNIVLLSAVIFFAVITRFIFLTDYPFVSVGDEVRDGGLNALEIAEGQIKNIFGYGRYNAHGLIIPTITSFFYKIFGNSVLVYRFPAAIVSFLDIILLYILLTVATRNKVASLLGSLVLVSLPLHLFYSRTEITIILSSFFATIILLSLFILFYRRTYLDYIFLGILAGFTFNFHASIKAFSLVVLLVIASISLIQIILKKIAVRRSIINVVLLLTFSFVGFGPRLLHTPLSIFLNTSRLPYTKKQYSYFDIATVKNNIIDKYQKSLLVWVKEPTNSWYPDHKPIFSPILFSLMVIGIVVGFIKKNWYLTTVLVITLTVHLTNSALTDIVNGDHRLAPLYPVGSLFVGVGVAFIASRINYKVLRHFLYLTFILYLGYKTVLFFTNQPANKNKDIGDYLSMHTIYFLRNSNDILRTSGNNVTLTVSPFNYEKLNYLHYKEQYAFFFPKLHFSIRKSDILKNNEIYIQKKGMPINNTITVDCKNNYYCPPAYKDNIIIHYSK